MKVYVDADGRLAKRLEGDARADEYVGQVEVRAAWMDGYNQMTVAEPEPSDAETGLARVLQF